MIPQGYPLVVEHESDGWLTVIGWERHVPVDKDGDVIGDPRFWPVVVSDHMPPRVVDPGELTHWIVDPNTLPDRNDWSHDLEPVTDGPGMWWEVDVRTGGEWVFRVRFDEAIPAHKWAEQADEPTRVRFVRIQAEDEYEE